MKKSKFSNQSYLIFSNSGTHNIASHSDSPHIDIYDNSEVQPPSYLNVKDAPEDSDAYKSESNYSTDITDNVKNVCGQSESKNSSIFKKSILLAWHGTSETFSLINQCCNTPKSK